MVEISSRGVRSAKIILVSILLSALLAWGKDAPPPPAVSEAAPPPPPAASEAVPPPPPPAASADVPPPPAATLAPPAPTEAPTLKATVAPTPIPTIANPCAKTPNPCNHGKCTPAPDAKGKLTSVSCACDPGYIGLFCGELSCGIEWACNHTATADWTPLTSSAVASALEGAIKALGTAGNFTTFIGLLQGTSTASQIMWNEILLKMSRPFTLFAPTDAAFSAVTEMQALEVVPNAIQKIVLYHFGLGYWNFTEFPPLSGSLGTVLGEPLRIDRDQANNRTIDVGHGIIPTVALTAGVASPHAILSAAKPDDHTQISLANLYNSPGAMFVHGIDAVLVPPGNIYISLSNYTASLVQAAPGM